MERKSKYTIFLLAAFVISALLMVVLCPLNAVNLYLTLIIQPIVYFIFTYLVLHKAEKKGYSLLGCAGSVLLGRIAMELPIRIMDFEQTFSTILPPICCMISILVAYIYYRYKCKAILFVILGILIWLYCIFYGQKGLLNYSNTGHFSSSVHISNFISEAVVYKSSDDSLRLKDLNYKYLLLDFWNSHCGYCYKQLPELQLLYDQYKSRKDVFVGGVFVKVRTDASLNLGDSLLRKNNYSFPTFATHKGSEFLLKSGVKSYPTTLILDENGTIILMGTLNDAASKLEELLGK